MKTGAASKSLGRGRGTAPFPGTPSPKTKTDRLHKSLDTPFVATMRPKNGKATAYICQNYVCNLPTNDPEVVARLLDNAP
jgi:uncharacterized protein YyaL (SSP411 family)